MTAVRDMIMTRRYNPHLWVSITNCMEQVRNLSEGIIALDPEHEAEYRENTETYLEKLSALRDKMHSALDHVKNKDIITFHEAFPYLRRNSACISRRSSTGSRTAAQREGTGGHHQIGAGNRRKGPVCGTALPGDLGGHHRG